VLDEGADIGGSAVCGAGASSGHRIATRLAIALLLALTCTALLSTASASALVHRGHVFGTTFEGSGANAFATVGGLAVDESTNEVYVTDPGHERVERFKPNGSGGYEFAAEFNKVPGALGVAVDNDPSSPSHGDVYVAGFKNKNEEERNYLYKFTSGGELLYKKHLFKSREKVTGELEEPETLEEEVEFEEINGISVDATGKVWVDWTEEGEVAALTNGVSTKTGPSDKNNKLIVSSIKEELAIEAGECRALAGFAVAPNDEAFYLRHERGTGFEACPEEGKGPGEVANALIAKTKGPEASVTAGVDSENSTGVAVDVTNGDVYVDNVTSIVAFTSGGTAIQRFGSGSLTGGGPLAADAANGQIFAAEAGTVAVFKPEEAGEPPSIDGVFAQNLTSTSTRLSALIDPRGADTHYYFQYGTADCKTTPQACTNVPVPPPGADLGPGFGDQLVSVTVEVQPATTYHFRVIAENAHGKRESSQLSSTNETFVTLPTSEGLLDHRQWEMVSPPKKGGTLASQSIEGASIQASVDGNAFTYGAETSGPVGGAQGNRSIAVTQFLSTRGSSEWSTQDIITPHNKGEGIVPNAGEEEYRLFSSDLSLAVVEPEVRQAQPIEDPALAPPSQTGEPAEKTLYLRADQPITPGSAEQAIYAEAAANTGYLAPGYLPLVTQLNSATHEPFGKSLNFIDATPDLNHVVFESEVPLTAGATGAGLYEWSSAGPGHALKLLSVAKLGESEVPASEPSLGAYPNSTAFPGSSRNAISSEGSRIFFTSAFEHEAEINSAAYLFMREPGTSKTIQVNAAQGQHAREPNEEERAHEEIDRTRFQTASTDGSKVFFTDPWPLTDNSSLHPTEAKQPADLYEFAAATHTLTDLTPDQDVGGADVLGTIPGASEDGSYVYFVANGVLAAGATLGNCPQVTPNSESEAPADAACNLYVSEPDASQPGGRGTRLIARLSARDGADWGVPLTGSVKPYDNQLTYLTSRVSPGTGDYLAFMSQESLTGYDNRDATAPGNPADQEVFLYNASRGSLVCASCNLNGQQPQGVFDGQILGEGVQEGLLVDQPQVWKNRWLAASIPGWTALTNLRSIYQSHFLDASGRLFFNSADPLVGQDKNHRMDVYEYEPEDVGSCTQAKGCVSLISSGAEGAQHESAFLDASADGSDVFFLTSQQLLSQDTDGAYDVYDARICGTSESGPCLPPVTPAPPECEGEGCRPAMSQQPSFQSGGTATASGANTKPASAVLPIKTKVAPKPPTRAQKLAKALKSCRSKYKAKSKKKQRLACEKQARKKYGAKKSSKGKKAKRASSRHGSRR
jgi:hypothetical protein